MSDTTTEETQEPRTKTPDEAKEEWKQFFERTQLGEPSKLNESAIKLAIEQLANAGIGPQSREPYTALDRLKIKQEQEDGPSKDPEDRLRRELNALDIYATAIEKNIKTEAGNIVPDGEVLKKNEKGRKRIEKNYETGAWDNLDAWEKYQWEREDVRAIISRLEAFKHEVPDLEMTDEEIQNTLELLLATGQSPTEILTKLAPAIVQQRWLNAKQIAAQTRTFPRIAFFLDANLDNQPRQENLAGFNIKEENLERYVLASHFERELQNEYQSSQPNNVEDFAWQIAYRDPLLFGLHGKFPVLEMRVTTDPATGKVTKGDYYVNEANMVRWLRQRMWIIYDNQRDEKLDFFGGVSLRKNFSSITLGNIFEEPGKFFGSKHVNKDGQRLNYESVAVEWIIEGWSTGLLRTMDVEYKRAPMGEAKPLNDKIKQLFYDSHLTKETFGTNIYNMLAVRSLNFESRKKGDTWVRDNLMGNMINDIYLTYDAMSDYKTLQDIWGRDSLAFTRNGMLQAIADVQGVEKETVATVNTRAILGYEYAKYFDKAFDKDGKISTQANIDAFINLINFFGDETVPGTLERTIRTLFTFAAEQKYGKKMKDKKGKVIRDSLGLETYGVLSDDGERDDYSPRLAEVAAYSQARISGAAAMNDTKTVGYDYAVRWFLSQTYRTKMPARGDFFGNPLTAFQFKGVAVDFYHALNTETYYTDETGKKRRNKTLIEVMKELNASNAIYLPQIKTREEKLDNSNLSEHERKRLEAEIGALERQMRIDWQDIAGQMVFKREAMQVYAKNHIERAQRLYDIIVKGKDINFEKYTHHDAFRGTTFKRAEFAEDIQQTLFKDARYMLSNYPDLNFNMKMRMLDQTLTKKAGRPVYRDMYLGERLFGYEMVNRKMFWKKENGRYVKDAYGRHEIDWEHVQKIIKGDDKGKTKIWKQFVMTKIAAEIRAHRSLHTTDPSYNLGYYLNIIDALETIPGEIEGDEYNAKRVRTPRNSFFDKADIAWLRRYAGIGTFRLYAVALLSDQFHKKQGEKSAFAAFLEIAAKHLALAA